MEGTTQPSIMAATRTPSTHPPPSDPAQTDNHGDNTPVIPIKQSTQPSASSNATWNNNDDDDDDDRDQVNGSTTHQHTTHESHHQPMPEWLKKYTPPWLHGVDLLLVLTLLGAALGILIGSLVRLGNPSTTTITLLGFPGEIMLRLLKLLVLPLIACSMISGVCSLRETSSGMAKLAWYTFSYYAISTVFAVLLGILLVEVIRPGRGQPLAGDAALGCVEHPQAPAPAPGPSQSMVNSSVNGGQTGPDMPTGALGALLGVFRSLFPDNLVQAAAQMNILGVIVFSLMFGIALSSLSTPGAHTVIQALHACNDAIAIMVMGVLWISPIGIASLIAASICNACNIGATVMALGLWMLTVLLGLVLMACVVLPAALWLLTRRNPWDTLCAFGPALALAFGTSSSSAALGVTMQCAKDVGCEDATVKFFLPLGTTCNMNGTALYEATTVLFIAQAHGVKLSGANVVVVAVTATLAAVGAAAIPSAGLVTMLMVLQAVNLEQFASDLAIILAVDWLLDRCRTVVNLMSDSFGTVIVDHGCNKGPWGVASEAREGDAAMGRNIAYTQLEMV